MRPAHYPEIPQPLALDPRQEDAVQLVLQAGFGVITGGPGTGKSTCLRQAVETLYKQRRSVALCAPTGKAARRLYETTGVPAQTVHRLLGVDQEHGGWAHDRDNHLPVDVVICDEASMLDTGLTAALLNAVHTQTTRVIFVGDANQLPSVGCGQVFHDLIRADRVPVVQLETVHRQAQESWVYRNAPRVLAGDLDGVELHGTFNDFDFVQVDEVADVPERLLDVYETELNRLEAGGMYDIAGLLDEVQILAPQKVGAIGTHALNDVIQEALHADVLSHRNGGFRVGDCTFVDDDKVMQTRNNYTLGVMNGETGIVVGVQDGNLDVDVNGNRLTYSRTAASDLLLGYAVTIHKSQGSEWPTVIVLAHSAHQRMLERRLFYTAITRAKGRLVVLGDRKGFEKAILNERSSERQTRLMERVQDVVGVAA